MTATDWWVPDHDLSPAERAASGSFAERRAHLRGVVASGDWDPDKHPRDERGRFGEDSDGALEVAGGVAVGPQARAIVDGWKEHFRHFWREEANPAHSRTDDEAAAVYHYLDHETAKEFNGALRTGSELTDEQKVLRDLMDSITAKEPISYSTITHDSTTVYRGMAMAHDFQVGEEFTDHGFSSTTPDDKSAEKFSTGIFGMADRFEEVEGRQPWLAEIRLPDGQTGAYGAHSLSEEILPRDTRFRVIDVGDPVDERGESRRLWLEVVR